MSKIRSTFDQVVPDRVIDPLPMHDTAFHAADINRFATAYQGLEGQLEVLDEPDGQWSRVTN